MNVNFIRRAYDGIVMMGYLINNLAYMLHGQYTYNDVELISERSDCNAIYGFSLQKGPVAFLGLPKRDFEFLFFKDVWEYGKNCPYEEYNFERYRDEDARRISNYTVYGVSGIEKIREFVKFEKINIFNDTRHKIKELQCPKIANMDVMLDGTYSFAESLDIAYHKDFKPVNNSIVFAIVDSQYPVGIIGLNHKCYIKGFRDVYEYGLQKPTVQSIRFLTNKNAKRIDDFELYIYDYTLPEFLEKRYNICKMDRSFDSRFDFYNTKSGKDYRLIKYCELLRKK